MPTSLFKRSHQHQRFEPPISFCILNALRLRTAAPYNRETSSDSSCDAPQHKRHTPNSSSSTRKCDNSRSMATLKSLNSFTLPRSFPSVIGLLLYPFPPPIPSHSTDLGFYSVRNFIFGEMFLTENLCLSLCVCVYEMRGF